MHLLRAVMAERLTVGPLTITTAIPEAGEPRVIHVRGPVGGIAWLQESQLRALADWCYSAIFHEHPTRVPVSEMTVEQALALLGFSDVDVARLADRRRRYLRETGQSTDGGDGLLAGEMVAHLAHMDLKRLEAA